MWFCYSTRPDIAPAEKKQFIHLSIPAFIPTLTHELIPTLTHELIPTLTHELIPTLTHGLIPTLTHEGSFDKPRFPHSLTDSFPHSPADVIVVNFSQSLNIVSGWLIRAVLHIEILKA